jgi:hypothetical protein
VTIRGVAFLILPLTLASGAGAQQITTGVIQGAVSDSTGASLPGVTVEVRIATNQSRSQVTEPDGTTR